jgi:hypothetical protein
MYQGYGQTEILPVAMMALRRWASSHCVPVSFAQLQIRGEDNNAVQPARRGEIVATCEATARRIVDGALYMLDRADDRGRDRRPMKEGECASASVTEKQLVNLCSLRGKIRRKELREPFWVGRERSVAGA